LLYPCIQNEYFQKHLRDDFCSGHAPILLFPAQKLPEKQNVHTVHGLDPVCHRVFDDFCGHIFISSNVYFLSPKQIGGIHHLFPGLVRALDGNGLHGLEDPE
jgi:hypothetical protein